MRSDDLRRQSPSSLLSTYAVILLLLQQQGVIRSYNHPVADVAEWLVSKKLGLKLAPKSTKSYDATDAENKRYQIKGRWTVGSNKSKQLGGIRDLDSSPFDFLVGVIFDDEFHVDYAALVPLEVVREHGRYDKRTNSHRFVFKRSVLTLDGVKDLSHLLRSFPNTDAEEEFLERARRVRFDQLD